MKNGLIVRLSPVISNFFYSSLLSYTRKLAYERFKPDIYLNEVKIPFKSNFNKAIFVRFEIGLEFLKNSILLPNLYIIFDIFPPIACILERFLQKEAI